MRVTPAHLCQDELSQAANSMSPFTSKRERSLWLALAITLAAIYATMGQAPAIVARLGADMLATTGDNLVLVLLLLLVIIPIFFVRKGASKTEAAVWAGILAVYALAWLRLGSLEARTHLAEYSMVAALIHEALLERRDNGGRVPAPALMALLLAVLLGGIDEGVQSLLPNRVFDPIDIAFNTLAAVMIIGARQLLTLARTRLQRQDT